ncbi:MAG: serine/threonine protein kinase, partial [Planctomycetes bacterium]|nr:serine/threonine protein kinase [Planctomycetota bacterium]
CEAMEYAHTLGIVHRDIKPENILMDKNGTPKIADFGLAKLILGDKKTEASLTMSGAFMGTAKYMAPEQFKDPKKVDHRADIYSLGAVFYEMLTGELPIGRFQPPSKKVKVDVQLDKVVLKALENEPELRYQRASHMGTDVKTINEKNPSAKDKMVQLKFEIDTKLEGLNQKQKSSIYTIGILVILAIFFFFISHTVSLFLFLAAVLLIWKYLLFKGNGEQHNQHHPAENQIAQQPAKKGLGWYILEILCYLLLLIWVSSVVTTIIAVMWALYPSVDWFGLGGWRGF